MLVYDFILLNQLENESKHQKPMINKLKLQRFQSNYNVVVKLFFSSLIVFLVACNNSNQLSILGTIRGGENETLYLEENTLNGVIKLDSIKLSEKGTFKFKFKTPQYPEIYQLRIKNQRVILAIDSHSEKIEVLGMAENLSIAEILGSKTSEEIQDLRQSIHSLQNDFNTIATTSDVSVRDTLIENFTDNLSSHKEKVKANILNDPLSLSAYYALFQQISDNYIFTPFDKEDRPYYQAVATAYTTNFPDSERSKNLYELVIAALQSDNNKREQTDWENLVKTNELGFIDIELPDRYGYPKKLSDLSGNLIVLDFMAYGVENSMNHTFALREIYDAYKDKGVKIYQVSLDESKTYWEHSVSAIPWICVFDETGRHAGMYNIQEIPSSYLIDQNGNILAKYSNLKDLEQAIRSRI